MKKLFFSFTLTLSIILLSCAAQIEPTEFTSPDGNMTIKVSGDQGAPLDDIEVTLKAQKEEIKNTYTFFLPADKLTKETISEKWPNDGMVQLGFSLRDDTKRQIEVEIVGNQIRFTDLTAQQHKGIEGLTH